MNPASVGTAPDAAALASCTIGVDMGTTTLKAAAFDEAGRELARAARSVKLFHPAEGQAEQEPQDVAEAITAAVAEVAAAARAQGYTVACVGISAAMHSLIPVADDGTPLGRAILWMDARAQAEAQELWDSAEGKALYAATGTPIHAMTPLVKLIWMRRRRPELLRQAARFVSLKEWVWRRWFGEWVVDASIASATGLYNLRTGGWDARALALAGISANQLSPIVPTTYVRTGVLDPQLLAAGIAPQTAFNVGASDGALANLGDGALSPRRMALTIGTSLAVRTGSPTPFTDTATRCFCYVLGPDLFVVGGPSNSGGIVLDWLFHDVLSDPADPRATLRLRGAADRRRACAERFAALPALCRGRARAHLERAGERRLFGAAAGAYAGASAARRRRGDPLQRALDRRAADARARAPGRRRRFGQGAGAALDSPARRRYLRHPGAIPGRRGCLSAGRCAPRAHRDGRANLG